MNLENMLSERSQTQKTVLYESICLRCPKQADLQRQKVDQWLPRAGEAEEKWRVTANGYGVPFWSDENFLKLIVMMIVQCGKYTKAPLHFML